MCGASYNFLGPNFLPDFSFSAHAARASAARPPPIFLGRKGEIRAGKRNSCFWGHSSTRPCVWCATGRDVSGGGGGGGGWLEIQEQTEVIIEGWAGARTNDPGRGRRRLGQSRPSFLSGEYLICIRPTEGQYSTCKMSAKIF